MARTGASCFRNLMPRTSQLVQVGRRTIEVSNLEKALFPGDGITKAELIKYYLKVA